MENLVELKREELEEIEGGIIFGLIAYAVNTSLVVGTVAAAGGYIAGMAEAGYDATCN